MNMKLSMTWLGAGVALTCGLVAASLGAEGDRPGFDFNRLPVLTVTSLADSGPGTLRTAVEGGNRRIVFGVSGVIQLQTVLSIKHSNLVIDGGDGSTEQPGGARKPVAHRSTTRRPTAGPHGKSGAPAVGVTIVGRPVAIADAENVTLRHLRIRDSTDDDLRISGACRNVTIEHCSLTRAGDGALDITLDYKTKRRPQDITVANCLFGATEKAMLITSASRVTLYGNLFTNNGERNPQLHDVDQFDMRYNVIRNWFIYGTRIRAGSSGNVVANVFGSSANPKKSPAVSLIAAEKEQGVAPVRIFAQGNLGPAGFDPNHVGNTPQQFPAPPFRAVVASQVEKLVLEGAGAQPRDAVDAELIRASAEFKYRPTETKDRGK